MRLRLTILCLTIVSLSSAFAQKIKFAPQWTPQSQFAGYYAAYENGYYKELGLDVDFLHPSNTYSSLNMLLDGTVQMVTSELIQAMMLSDKECPMVNILQTTQHSTLVLLSRSAEVDELSDLAGRKIGTWKIGFSEIPHMIDQQENLNIEWIKLINSLNVYISGAIDATLVKSYNDYILFAMSGVTPGSVLKFADHGFDFPEDGLYVTEEFYNKNTEACKKFAQASRNGWEWARNNREAALNIVMKYVKENKVATNRYNQKWMLESILEVQEDVKGGAPSYSLKQEDFNRLNDALLKYGYISKHIDYYRFMGGDL